MFVVVVVVVVAIAAAQTTRMESRQGQQHNHQFILFACWLPLNHSAH